MVPSDWRVYHLSDVTKWSSGGTPFKGNPEYWGGDIPWISAASMRGHYYSNSGVKITKKAVVETAKMAEKDSILLLVRGSMLWNKIPVGITTRKVAFNQDVKCISPQPKNIDIKFLLYWFLSKENFLLGMVTGTGIGAGKLDTGELQNLSVFLPPLPEQKRIAKILAAWDKAINTTERLIDNSQQQKKALMQKLLTGKKRLLDNDGVLLSEKWKERSIESLGSISSGGTPSTSNKDYWDGGIDWVTPTDITKQNSIYISSSKRGISKDGLKNSSAKLVPKGSLLICTRATIGEMAITSHEMCTNQGFKNIVPNESADIEFIYYLLSYCKHKLIRASSGSTFLELSKSVFESMVYEIPGIDEQKKISSILLRSDKEVELLEQQLSDLKQEKKALMQQLLTGKRRVKYDKGEAA
jgi:type I restriction enzyme S subunit